MTAIVCIQQSDADGYRLAMRVKVGLPLPGLDCPGGYHQPGGGVTADYMAVRKHPTLSQWAVEPYDALVQAQAIALPAGAAVQALDATWIPVVAIGGAVDAQADAEVPP